MDATKLNVVEKRIGTPTTSARNAGNAAPSATHVGATIAGNAGATSATHVGAPIAGNAGAPIATHVGAPIGPHVRPTIATHVGAPIAADARPPIATHVGAPIAADARPPIATHVGARIAADTRPTTTPAPRPSAGTFVALEVSYELIAALRAIMPAIRNSDRDLADQLQRAASSVALNIAEGQRSMKGNRLKHYAIAHGSANEVKAGLCVAEAWGWIESERAAAAFLALDRLLGLLWGLTHR